MTNSTHWPAPRLDRVVVALDFSDPSVLAAEWVARQVAPGAELILVHVIHVPAPPRFLQGRYPSAERVVETARAGAELRLRELASSLATGLVWTEVRIGKPDEEIVRVAAQYRADVIVIGRPAPRSGVWGRLGTTAQRVLRRATVPVLLAAEMTPRTPRRVLVGLDDSDLTGPVLDWTRFLLERFVAAAVVMHVVHPRDFDHTSTLMHGLLRSAADALEAAPAGEEPRLRDARHWLEERITEQLGTEASASPVRERMTLAALEGLPADVLVLEAARREIDLVILGSRGAGAVQRFLLGSVAEKVLQESRCPVLVVVRPDDPLE